MNIVFINFSLKKMLDYVKDVKVKKSHKILILLLIKF
jgi:hypothetical protein